MGECFMFGRGKLVTLDPVFANNDWSKIISACQRGSIPDTWAVGDQKAMTINGTDYMIDIIGFNHDDYSDGSGKAPITFQMHDCYNTRYGMNTSASTSGGWTSCEMRSTTLPVIKASMPTEVQAALRTVNKLTTAGGQSSTINTTADDLFILSEVEVFGTTIYSNAVEGTQYAYYAEGNSKIKYYSGITTSWWERSPYNALQFCSINTDGSASASRASTPSGGVAFAFCF